MYGPIEYTLTQLGAHRPSIEALYTPLICRFCTNAPASTTRAFFVPSMYLISEDHVYLFLGSIVWALSPLHSFDHVLLVAPPALLGLPPC